MPNFIRGALVPIAFLFTLMREEFGLLPSAVVIGAATACIGILSMLFSEETFNRNLDMIEN